MNTQTIDSEIVGAATIYAEKIIEDEATYYPAELKDEIGETAFHFKLIRLLSALLESFFASRADVTIAANMMVYYEKGNMKR